MPKTERIGILTGGGDAAGGNPVLLGADRAAQNHGVQLVYFVNGWEGPLTKKTMSIEEELLLDKRHKAGTLIGTSRTNPGKIENGYDIIAQNLMELGIDGLIPVGGDDTNGVGYRLYKNYGVHVVGIAWTMDGDLGVYCLGFNKAVSEGVEGLKKLETVSQSMNRVGIEETFGRDSGMVAMAIAGAYKSDVVLIPEIASEPSYVCDVVKRVYNHRAERNGGRGYATMLISEGHKYKEGDSVVKATLQQTDPQFGHEKLGGIGEKYAAFIKQATGISTANILKTYEERGGDNTWVDQQAGFERGYAAVEALVRGMSGVMILDITENGTIRTVPIEKALHHDENGKAHPHPVSEATIRRYEAAGYNFGREPSKHLWMPRITVVNRL